MDWATPEYDSGNAGLSGRREGVQKHDSQCFIIYIGLEKSALLLQIWTSACHKIEAECRMWRWTSHRPIHHMSRFYY